MEKKRERTDFEMALDLIKFQYENDPYKMTKEQLDVLDLNDRIVAQLNKATDRE
jgi:hypothetical protein